MSERWLPAWGLASIGFGGASLIVPLYLVELGGDAALLGVLFATASFVGVPGSLVFGNLADRTGKRRVFVLGAMAVGVATLIAIPATESLALVIAANALLWLGFAAAVPVLTLLVVTGEPESRWTALIARLNEYQGFGWALGLAVGFVVIAVGSGRVGALAAQRAVFAACAASAGLGLALGVRRLPADPAAGAEPSPRRLRRRLGDGTGFSIRAAAFPFTPARFDPRGLHPRSFAARYTPSLATYFLAVTLVFAGFGVFFAPLPAYLSAVGFGADGTFALYLVLNVGAAVFYGPAATLAARYDVADVQVGGLLVRGAALPAVAALGSVFGGSLLGFGAVGAALFVIGLSWAVIAVTAATLVTSLAPAGIRGESLGVYGALVAVGGGVGGLVGGWLASLSYALAFAVAGGVVFAGAVVVTIAARQAERSFVADTDTA